MYVNTSSVASVVLSAECATGKYIQIAVRSLEWTSQCLSLRWRRNRQTESCQRAQTTQRVATDLGRSATSNADIAGNVLGVSTGSMVEAVVGMGRSTVRGMSSVMQTDDGDDKERTEDDVGALQDQIDRLTQRLAKVTDADDKHDFESTGADVGDTLQDNPAASQAMFHRVHTPRHEQDTSSKLDGDQDCERNAKRTTFSGSVFPGCHGQGTPKFAQDQGSARVMRRNSFSGPESSTRRQSSLFNQDASGKSAV